MSNTWEFLRFPPLGLLSKLRLGATIFYASRVKGWKRLEQIPVTVWLQRWSGKQTLQKIWLPLLRAKLGDNHKKTSAAFICLISRMYAARRSGLKKEMFGYMTALRGILSASRRPWPGARICQTGSFRSPGRTSASVRSALILEGNQEELIKCIDFFYLLSLRVCVGLAGETRS
jgi:protoporphyrinogen oxidase